MSSLSINQIGEWRRSALVRRLGFALSTVLTLTLGALTLAGPAAAAPLGSGPVNSIFATIPVPAVGSPEFTNVDPVRGVVWSTGPTATSEISERTNQVIQTFSLLSGDYPDGVTVDPRTGDLLLANTNATLTILNGRTGAQTVVNVGSSEDFFGRGVAVDPVTGLIYVADTPLKTVFQPGFNQSLITVVRESTGTVLDQISDPNGAEAIAIDPLSRTVYVGNIFPGDGTAPGSSVWVIKEATNQVVDTISEPYSYPGTMTVDPASGKVFVTNFGDGPLTVISTRTDAVTAEVSLGGANLEPDGVAADSANGMVYVDNYGDTQVWVVNEKTNTVVDTITVPVTYGFLDVDPFRGVLYQGSDTNANDPTATSTVEAIRVAPGSGG